MKTIMKIVKISQNAEMNNKVTAHVEISKVIGLVKQSIWFYADPFGTEGQECELTQDELNALKFEKRESKTNPGRHYLVLAK